DNSSAARSASVNTVVSRQAATRFSRTDVSPALAASLVCMSRQPPQPLIWLARIFTNSRVVAGNVESVTALFAAPMYFWNFGARSVPYGLSRMRASSSLVDFHLHDEDADGYVTTNARVYSGRFGTPMTARRFGSLTDRTSTIRPSTTVHAITPISLPDMPH